MNKLWEQVKELEDLHQSPKIFPTVEASEMNIASDLETHGCAYVVDTPQGFYMVHPNKITVYGTPKIAGNT